MDDKPAQDEEMVGICLKIRMEGGGTAQEAVEDML